MKKIICLFACLYAGSANAIVTSGNLFDTGTGSTVDYWGFSTTGGLTTIDTLSWEIDGTSSATGIATDVNGDGEIAFFDTYIHLFSDDGSLDAADWITGNDDDHVNGFGDGSVYGWDSFLELNLGAGDYILVMGAYHMTVDEAITGVNDPNSYPSTCTGNIGEVCGSRIGNDHGDYQITWSDNVAVTSDPGTGASVPEPSILALLGLGLAGIGFSRKKKTA